MFAQVLWLSVWLTLLLALSITLVAGPTCNLISHILALNINMVHINDGWLLNNPAHPWMEPGHMKQSIMWWIDEVG